MQKYVGVTLRTAEGREWLPGIKRGQPGHLEAGEPSQIHVVTSARGSGLQSVLGTGAGADSWYTGADIYYAIRDSARDASHEHTD